VDGEVVPRAPMDSVASGAGSDLALLVGTTSEELTATARRPAMTERRAEKRLAALGLGDAGQADYRARIADPGLRVAQAVTDRTFRMPALRVAEARSAAPASTFHYEFSWRTPALGGLGAVHCLDLPFVFDVLDDDHAKLVAGDEAPQALADEMHSRWVAFVRDSDAGWTPFDGAGRATMVFDTTSEVVGDLHGPIRSLWP
jgi:para-nitrobenzyl esterase